MEKMMDVYRKVDEHLIEGNFYNCTVGEQKELVEEGLKIYVARKIKDRDLFKGMEIEKKLEEFSLDDLVSILGALIPENKHFDTLRHLTHYILNVAGGMQNFSITWWEEDDEELINNPKIEFNDEGLWDSLTCHKDTSYVETFHFVNHVFQEEFKNKKKDNKHLVLTPTKKELPEYK